MISNGVQFSVFTPKYAICSRKKFTIVRFPAADLLPNGILEGAGSKGTPVLGVGLRRSAPILRRRISALRGVPRRSHTSGPPVWQDPPGGSHQTGGRRIRVRAHGSGTALCRNGAGECVKGALFIQSAGNTIKKNLGGKFLIPPHFTFPVHATGYIRSILST